MEVLFLLDTHQGSQSKKVESHCSYNTTAYEYKVTFYYNSKVSDI